MLESPPSDYQENTSSHSEFSLVRREWGKELLCKSCMGLTHLPAEAWRLEAA
jgi:hypothetical protein